MKGGLVPYYFFIFSSFNTLSIVVLSLYLNRIYQEVKKDPTILLEKMKCINCKKKSFDKIISLGKPLSCKFQNIKKLG